MNPETKKYYSNQKSNIKTADFEKRNIRRALGNLSRDIISMSGSYVKYGRKTECVDFILVCDCSEPDILKEKLESLDYRLTHKDPEVFTAEKHGKTISLFAVMPHSKNFYLLSDFCEYLTVNSQKEKEYINLKNRLSDKNLSDEEKEETKFEYIKRIAKEAGAWKVLGKKVNVSKTEDNESCPYILHGIQYELNTGLADRKVCGKETRAFIMGVKKPVHRFSGKTAAVIEKDGETYLVVSPLNKIYYEPDIKNAVGQALDLSDAKITCLYEKSCGAVVYKKENGKIFYLLIKNRSRNIGFPKGHVEEGENELDTAAREIFEETNVRVKIDENFRISYNYNINFFIKKQAVYYIAEVTDGEIRIPEEEILSYHLVPFKEAQELLSYPNEKRILRNANQYIKNKRG